MRLTQARVQTSAIALAVMAGFSGSPSFAQDADTGVTIVLREEPTSLDGCNASRSVNGRVTKHNVVEGLTMISAADGSVNPALATSWEQLDDVTWRFTLREGVTFHDGSAFNAEAAARSIERLIGSDLDCHARGEFFAQVTVTPTAIDDLTLELVSSVPLPILPTYMAQAMIVSPNTPMDALAQTAVGTGPYMFETYEPGVEIVLARNDDWWGEQPAAERARFVWRAESSVGAAMVQIGEADLAPYIAPQDATNPETDLTYPTAETVFLRIDTLLPPFDDLRMREALNLAVDREGLQGTIFPAESIQAVAISPPFIPGYPGDVAPYAYDPDQARALIDEARAAGVPVDTEIQYFVRNGHFTNASEAAEAIAAMWADVGLNINLRFMEAAEWSEYNFAPLKADRGANVLQARTGNPYGDASFNLTNKIVCDSSQSALCDAEIDALVEQATIAGGEDRLALWSEIYHRLYEDDVFVPLFHLVSHVRIGERIDFTPDIFLTDAVDLTAITFK